MNTPTEPVNAPSITFSQAWRLLKLALFLLPLVSFLAGGSGFLLAADFAKRAEAEEALKADSDQYLTFGTRGADVPVTYALSGDAAAVVDVRYEPPPYFDLLGERETLYGWRDVAGNYCALAAALTSVACDTNTVGYALINFNVPNEVCTCRRIQR